MEISKHVHENTIMVLEIIGEIDAYTAQNLSQTFADVMGDGYSKIVLDVSQVVFISSAGIRAILYAHKDAVQLGCEVRLAGPTDQVYSTLEIAGVFELLQVSDSLEEVIENW